MPDHVGEAGRSACESQTAPEHEQAPGALRRMLHT